MIEGRLNQFQLPAMVSQAFSFLSFLLLPEEAHVAGGILPGVPTEEGTIPIVLGLYVAVISSLCPPRNSHQSQGGHE